MESKSSIVVKIVVLSILAVFLLGVMVFFMFFKGGFKKFVFSFGDVSDSKLVLTETYSVEDIKKFDFNLRDADLDIRYSDSNEVKLEVYDKKKENVLVSLNDGILQVDYGNYTYFCLGFCFNNRRAVLYLPMSYDKVIDISSASGDINLESFENVSLSVSTASGDVKLGGALKASISTASGEVNVKNIPTLTIKTVSGDIDVNNVQDLDGSSVSGEVNVNGLGNSIDFKTTSGDFELRNVTLNSNSKLSSVSGDVEISGINKVYVSTSTLSGDVDIITSDRMSEIELSIKTTSGDIEVK